MGKERRYVKIAVTGGIGSGKSTVCGLLKEEGYAVFSCDAIYAKMIESEYFAMALEILFPGVTNDGKIDKKRLSSVVFSGDKYALCKLNAFTHPLIMQNLFAETDKAANDANCRTIKIGKKVENSRVWGASGKDGNDASEGNGACPNVEETEKVVFAEVPLLFEEGYETLFDYVIVVEREETERIKSVTVRDRCDEKTVRGRMSAQFDYGKRGALKNRGNIVVLRNDCEISELRRRVICLIENL